MKSYSIDIANAIKSFLVEDDWDFSFDEKKGIFKFGLSTIGNITAKNAVEKCEGDVDKGIREVLEEMASGADEDTRSMLERLAARLGGAEETRAASTETDIKNTAGEDIDPHVTKGGAE